MTETAKQTRFSRPLASSGTRGHASKRANAFPKAARLLKHASFQDVYDRGRKHFSANMIFFYVLRPLTEGETNEVHIGLTVGRALGGAVVRNRIKRRMRDVVRHNFTSLQSALAASGISADIVINPKKAALTADMAALRAEIQRGFNIIAGAPSQR